MLRPIIASGAAGILLAALFYFVGLALRDALAFLVPPSARAPIIIILFGVSFVEIVLMIFALRRLRDSGAPPALTFTLNFFYVAFAGVYGALYLILGGAAAGAAGLTALSVVRLFSALWLR